MPFGDIHRDSPLNDTEKWLEFCEWGRGKKNAYFLGMGDYHDFASTSERLILENPALHESTKENFETMIITRLEQFAKEIDFMKGKLIGLIEGNHYWKFQSGITTTQKLCEMLDCKYLGVSAFVSLVIMPKVNGRSKQMNLHVFAHHGKAGARTVGGSLNKVEQMGQIAEADIYLMAHDHRKSSGFASKLRLSTTPALKLHQRKQLYARTGSFLRGYEPERASYIADACLPPTDLGVVKIELTPKRDQSGKNDSIYCDIHASI